MKKLHERLLFTTSNEYIWTKIFLIFMHGLKFAILAIFQKDFRARILLRRFSFKKVSFWELFLSKKCSVENFFFEANFLLWTYSLENIFSWEHFLSRKLLATTFSFIPFQVWILFENIFSPANFLERMGKIQMFSRLTLAMNFITLFQRNLPNAFIFPKYLSKVVQFLSFRIISKSEVLSG